MKTLGIVPVGALIVGAIIDMVKSGMEANIAASNAAAQYNYFRDIEDNDFMQMALELQKQLPIYDYKKWFFLLKQLKNYGLIKPPRPGGEVIIPVITPPGDNVIDKQNEKTNYLPWMIAIIGLIILIRR